MIYLSVHGHFYQPRRDDPATGEIPREYGAEPYSNFNEKIHAECYAPNARERNYERLSFARSLSGRLSFDPAPPPTPTA